MERGLHMRKLTSLLGAVALTGAVFAAGTASAGAAEPTTARAAASAACWKGKTAQAKESVKIRKSKKLNATALGLFPKGKKGKYAGCEVSYGQTYTLCGWDKDNRWTYIEYRGTKGWVPSACEKWVP
jgi:hypothetical protein